MEDITPAAGPSRRTVVKGAAWAVPVIAVAAATPLAAASGEIAVNGFSVDGSCGLLGVAGVGFTVAAGADPIPVGTQIVLTSTALVNLNLVSLSGQGLASVSLLGDNSLAVNVTSEIPAGGTLTIQWLLSVSLLTTTTAALTLPSGYTAGTGTKPQGSLEQTLVICNAS